MPIYEYQCGACGHRLEMLQKFSDAPLVNCPECSEPGLQKLVSASAFHLKGSGWYATDFRDKGKAPPANDSAGADKVADTNKTADAGAKDSKSSDTK